jgi:hypothetical protein
LRRSQHDPCSFRIAIESRAEAAVEIGETNLAEESVSRLLDDGKHPKIKQRPVTCVSQEAVPGVLSG